MDVRIQLGAKPWGTLQHSLLTPCKKRQKAACRLDRSGGICCSENRIRPVMGRTRVAPGETRGNWQVSSRVLEGRPNPFSSSREAQPAINDAVPSATLPEIRRHASRYTVTPDSGIFQQLSANESLVRPTLSGSILSWVRPSETLGEPL